MRATNRWQARLALAACLAVAGCGGSTAAESHEEPAKVDAVAGTDLKRLTLTPRAAQRLGIRTTGVGTAGSGAAKTIPYSAVIYDQNGKTFAYTAPNPLVYVRAPIAVRSIADGVAVLSAGPPRGTAVVTVGAAELYGEELGVGH